jgi:putative FmdB family regulatory protein
MPIYEYLCQNCGHAFEEMQSMMEDSLIKCPNCGKNSLKRLLGAGSGVIFKGSGFYINDYKKNKPSETKPSHSKTGKKETTDTKENTDTKESKPKESKKEKKSDKHDKK